MASFSKDEKVLLYHQLSRNQKIELIMSLQQDRIRLFEAYRKDKVNSLLPKSKRKPKALKFHSPELQSIFDELPPEAKKYLTGGH